MTQKRNARTGALETHLVLSEAQRECLLNALTLAYAERKTDEEERVWHETWNVISNG